MKNYVLKMVTAVIAMMPLAAPAVNSIIHTATYDFSNMTVGLDSLGGTPYKTLHYLGLYNGGEPGAPSLPIDYIRFSVPHNATNFTVTAVLRDNTFANLGNYMVYPCQQPRQMSDTSAWTITLPDSNIYNSNAYYPASNAWVASEGFLAGENHIVTVAVAPVSYRHNVVGNTASNQLRQSRTVRLTLSYELSDTLAMYPIVRQNDALRQEGYALTRSMVANPQNVESFAPVDIAMDSLIFINPNSGDGTNGIIQPIEPIDSTGIDPNPGMLHIDSGDYLIITTEDFKDDLRRLAAYKRQKGYDVKIVSIDEVMSDEDAGLGDIVVDKYGFSNVAYDDSAGILRQYLKKAYKHFGTKYVFFVGEGVPYRCKDCIAPNGDMVPQIPMDLYFSDLNSDYSQLQFTIDVQPELYVGRLLAKRPEQIINYTDKLLRYELNPGNGDYSYLKRILYSEGSDLQIEKHFEYVHPYYSQVFSDSCHIKEQYQNEYPSGTDIINKINETKSGYLSFGMHGSPSGYISYGLYNNPEFTNAPVFYYLWAIDSAHIVYDNRIDDEDTHTGNGFNNLSNKWHPNICYSVGCSTMPFDKMPHYDQVETNLGESFTTGKDYGGPAFLGATRETYTGVTITSLENSFVQQLIYGNCHVGMAEALSKANLSLPYNYIKFVHNLLGEPEFEIWTSIPQEYSNVTVSRTDNSITISGLDATDSTMVSCIDNKGVIRSRIASSGTVTFNNVSPNSSVMLHKHNSIPYFAPVMLQNTILNNSQYLIADDVMIGCSVDNARTNGVVTIVNGVDYEIESSGIVTLSGGFNVEKGATFKVSKACFKQ